MRRMPAGMPRAPVDAMTHHRQRQRRTIAMKRSVAFFFTVLILVATSAPLAAQQRIFALVNDEVISGQDVENRLNLTLVTSGMAPTPENRKRMEPQVLRGLVDEKLQLQEASRVGVFVTDREVADAIARIEQSNRLAKGQLEAMLKQSGMGLTPLEQQVRSTIAWQKLTQRRLRPQIQVTDEEIDEFQDRLKARQGAPEFLLSEIFLPMDNPEQEDDVRQTALSLIQQMQRGTPFSAIAQQFSRSASASAGGDIGWVQEGQLDGDIEAAVRELKLGEVTPPVRMPGGFYILGLRARRAIAAAPADEAVVALTQLVFPARTPQELAASEQLAQGARAAIADCAGLDRLATELRIQPPAEPQRLRIAEVNPAVREKVRGLRAGQASEPIRAGATLVVLVACAREEPPSGLPSRDDIEELLTRQRLEILSRRYLRDLRRQANVEIRA